jgi:hypothetical protein
MRLKPATRKKWTDVVNMENCFKLKTHMCWTATATYQTTTTTYLVLASYHNTPSDFNSTQQWVEVNMN